MLHGLGQVAFSVRDLRITSMWYEEVLGYRQAGRGDFSGEMVENVTGVAGADLAARWLIDQQERFQLELFQVKAPPARPRPADWRPCDIGYTLIGVHVDDFDSVVDRARTFGTPVVGGPVGTPGKRRICVADPDGVLVEIMEDDPRAQRLRARPGNGARSALRFVTLSVADLAASRSFLVDTMGLEPATDVTLHGPEHESLWGLAGAQRDTVLLWADDMLVEIVQYRDPVGRPWRRGHRLTDLGILNIALLFRERSDLTTRFDRLPAAGGRPNHPQPMEVDGFTVMYVNDAQDFSFEMLHVEDHMLGPLGFELSPSDITVKRDVSISASLDAVWGALVDHDAASRWMGDETRLFTSADRADGVGAVRELGSAGHAVLERVVHCQPRERLDLRVERGGIADGMLTTFELSSQPDGRILLQCTRAFLATGQEHDKALAVDLASQTEAFLKALQLLCESQDTAFTGHPASSPR